MTSPGPRLLLLLTAALGLSLGTLLTGARAPQTPVVAVDPDDIGGTVTGPSGPEAGVWVIAETRQLGTPFNRTVVTDDEGRFVVPDLPAATYDVWVRGYGLADSAKTRSARGRTITIKVSAATSPRAAAEIYPAGHWLSLMEIPAKSEFPGTGPTGNGINPQIQTQAQFLRLVKSGGCFSCHNLGTKGTREIPAALGAFPTSAAAWERRVASGQAGQQMVQGLAQLGRDRAVKMFADWTDRIAKGEVPPAPARPSGLERNVVITQWDWADPRAYLHDEVSTDRRNPRVNGNGLIYGFTELSTDYLPVLDPVRHTITQVPLTVRDPNTPFASQQVVGAPSAYFGSEPIWTGKSNVHNGMFDGQGRVWLAATVRAFANPEVCKTGSNHPSAKAFPMNGNASRHLAVYDPRTRKYTHISTCFGTHHVMFAEDADNTLWTSGGGQVIGWLNTKQFDATGDEYASQGWTPLIMDTNGNGRRDPWVEPNQPVDPTKDKRYGGSFYAVSPAPDGSIWGSSLGFPGSLMRLTPGANPSETALVEVFEPPFNDPKAPAYTPRGMDVDRLGVAWVALASGHLASFDRRKCKGPLNGPNATGQHCPEGWTLYTEPLPQFKGVTDPGSVGASYYTWVDQFDTFGLGPNTPINTGNSADGLIALKDGKTLTLRVPYPTGYYTKWLDGRIDDPNTGWKGRGLYSTISTRAPFHMETGKGTTSKVVRFQLRPNPLAK
jgi:hypothetical protein